MYNFDFFLLLKFRKFRFSNPHTKLKLSHLPPDQLPIIPKSKEESEI